MSPRKIPDPSEIDAHVGRRVKGRRKMFGVSQDSLADGLDLTFQQVQKYERGSNRISASKLYQIAHILEVPVSYFFEGLDDPAPSGGDDYVRTWSGVVEDLLATPNGKQLAEAFLSIRRRSVRKGLVDLAREVAASDQVDAEDDRPSGRSDAE